MPKFIKIHPNIIYFMYPFDLLWQSLNKIIFELYIDNTWTRRFASDVRCVLFLICLLLCQIVSVIQCKVCQSINIIPVDNYIKLDISIKTSFFIASVWLLRKSRKLCASMFCNTSHLRFTFYHINNNNFTLEILWQFIYKLSLHM